MNRIYRPIFLIGMPRSGTTVVFEALSRHEQVAWLSHYLNYLVSWPACLIGCAVPGIYRLSAVASLPRGEKSQGQKLSRLNRYLPRPDECYPLWEHCCGERFSRDYLLGVHASPRESCRLRRVVQWCLDMQGKSRFAAKITGPSRIEYLRSIFPDAIFVHIIRDPRAVAGSLLKVRFWQEGGGLERPWWSNGLDDGWECEWIEHGRSPFALAVIQWRTVIEKARQESAAIAASDYIEVRYEDFVSRPQQLLNRLLPAIGLAPSQAIGEQVCGMERYRNMNSKHYASFVPEQERMVEELAGSLLTEFGYRRVAGKSEDVQAVNH